MKSSYFPSREVLSEKEVIASFSALEEKEALPGVENLFGDEPSQDMGPWRCY